MWLVVLSILLLGACINGSPENFLNILQKAQLSVTGNCAQQLDAFFANFSYDPNSWALQMIDATSKVPSGPLSLNFGELGDFQQCINVKGKYCLGYISLGTTMQQIPTWALCLPDDCTTNDADIIGNLVLSGQGVEVNFSDFLCQTVEDVNPEMTTKAMTTIVILASLSLIVLVCTFYDTYSIFHGRKTCALVVKGFSVYSNVQKIFKMSTSASNQLPCLNGLKFISMMWVVLGHQYSISLSGSITNLKNVIEWADSLRSMFVISGTLSVDTFFTVSGTLVSFCFMKAKTLNLPVYYLHRYLRLTPPFALVVLVSATLLKYMGSGPKWPFLVLYFQGNCENYWWSALLYTQNYLNVSSMCVGQTWYLDIDSQLYLISPVLAIGLRKYPKLCLLFLGLCSLASIGASFNAAWEYELPAILSNFYNTHATDYQNKYYLLTHTRATPWIFGVILGYYLSKIEQNKIEFKLKKFLVWIMWVVCLGSLTGCLFLGHGTLRGPDYDKWGNALHIALVRPAWSLAITWIILACTTNYGGPVNWVLSHPIFHVLNKFTYSIYLTHVTMLFVVVYDRKWSSYFSEFNMAYQFWGTLSFSTALAMVLVFMVESPMMVFEKVILNCLTVKDGRKVKNLLVYLTACLNSLANKLSCSSFTFQSEYQMVSIAESC